MKICANPKCKKLKELTDFYRDRSTPDGFTIYCKECKNTRHLEFQRTPDAKNKAFLKRQNVDTKLKSAQSIKKYRATQKGKEVQTAANKKYYQTQKGKNNVIKQARLAKTPEGKAKGNSRRAKSYKESQGVRVRCRASVSKRKAQKLKATPPWLTNEQYLEIKDFYLLTEELQWLSEEPLQVDHIVPLQGENVSGLHVPWNLQILPRSLNIRKGNRI
jgi:hypothetical protein